MDKTADCPFISTQKESLTSNTVSLYFDVTSFVVGAVWQSGKTKLFINVVLDLQKKR